VRFVLNNAAMDSTDDNDENVSYIGQALIESVSLSGGFDETSTYSVSLSGYGKLYKYQA
jgi:predicted secreted protein